jgi:hypothetical protein
MIAQGGATLVAQPWGCENNGFVNPEGVALMGQPLLVRTAPLGLTTYAKSAPRVARRSVPSRLSTLGCLRSVPSGLKQEWHRSRYPISTQIEHVRQSRQSLTYLLTILLVAWVKDCQAEPDLLAACCLGEGLSGRA